MEPDPDRARRSPDDGSSPGFGDRNADRAFDDLLRRHAVLGSPGSLLFGDGVDGARNGRPPGRRPDTGRRASDHRPTGSPPTNGPGPRTPPAGPAHAVREQQPPRRPVDGRGRNGHGPATPPRADKDVPTGRGGPAAPGRTPTGRTPAGRAPAATNGTAVNGRPANGGAPPTGIAPSTDRSPAGRPVTGAPSSGIPTNGRAPAGRRPTGPPATTGRRPTGWTSTGSTPSRRAGDRATGDGRPATAPGTSSGSHPAAPPAAAPPAASGSNGSSGPSRSTGRTAAPAGKPARRATGTAADRTDGRAATTHDTDRRNATGTAPPRAAKPAVVDGPGRPPATPSGHDRGRTDTPRRGSTTATNATTDADDAPAAPAAAPAPAPGTRNTAHPGVRRRPRLLRLSVALLAALIVAATGAGAAARSWLDGAVAHLGALDPQSSAIRNLAAQAGDENVVVLTTDFPAPGRPPNPPAGSLVVAHVPRDSDSVVALSLPADLEITRPPCERWDPGTRNYIDQTVPAEVRTTLLSAFEVGGPRCTTKVVQQLTGIAISRFVALDRAGVAAMARAVGVDPCPPGPPPATDYDRIEREHGQLRAVLTRTLSFATLLNPSQVRALHDALPAAALSDEVDLGRLLGISQALETLDADRITYAAAPTAATPNSRGNRELREAEANVLFKALREDTALPAQAGAASGASAEPPLHAADVTVDVLNASGRDGLAKRVAERLTGFGYVVDEVGNADGGDEATTIVYSPDRTAAADLLASSLPGATLTPQPSSSGVLELVLGSGFTDIVQAPVALTPTAAGPGCT